MQVVDRITSSGYSYIAPTVDRACNVVPLLGGIKQRFEPFAPPLIQKADLCIDTVYGVVEVRATALRGAANSAGSKAFQLKDAAYNAVEERTIALRDTGARVHKMVGESAVVVRVHKTSLAIVDTLDMLIDRYLPEAEPKDGKKSETSDDLIPRILHIPFKIPVRMMHISIAKARGGRDVIQVRIQWASQLTSDQKAKLQAFILSRTQAISNRFSSSSLAITLRRGKQSTSKMLEDALQSIRDGKKAAGVRCYILLEQLHVIEMKDWLLRTVGSMQQATLDGTSDVIAATSQRAYNVTSVIVGQDRATDVFAFVGKRLPIVKIAALASASTGALPDTPSREAELEIEPKTESSTGATEKVTPPVAKTEQDDKVVSNIANPSLDGQVSETVEAHSEKLSQQSSRSTRPKNEKKVPLKVPRVQRAFN